MSRSDLNAEVAAAEMPEPTDALPGTPEKVLVLEERARRGQCLWHPLDARLDRSAVPVREEECAAEVA